MPRLRDTRTDVVVSVDDDTAKVIGAAYEPVDEKKVAAKKVPPKSEK